jgi:hypothetical protein
MTFYDLAVTILKETQMPMSQTEIWEYAKSKGYDLELGSQGKTPASTIGALIYVNIRDKKNSPFGQTDTRPKKFFLKDVIQPSKAEQIAQEQSVIVAPASKSSFLEKDLHPFLAYFVRYYLKSYAKTIQHLKSDKRDFGEWVHPDMVSCYFPLDDWKPEVIDFSSAIGNVSIKICSFEIKKELGFYNLRESFFQTVSNSSWAHESYLVAADISNEEDFIDELKRLSTSFGIGIIKLDLHDPDSSEIVFPANNKEYLDWDTINKLSTMNPDFREFLKRIKTDISSQEIRKEKYDKVIDKEALQATIKMS